MRSEGFYVNEKSSDSSWDRTSDLSICSTFVLPRSPDRVTDNKIFMDTKKKSYKCFTPPVHSKLNVCVIFFLILTSGYMPVPRKYRSFCLHSDKSNEKLLLQCFFSQNGKHNDDKKCVKVACDCTHRQTCLLYSLLTERVVFRRVRKIAKINYWLRHVCPSVCFRPPK